MESERHAASYFESLVLYTECNEAAKFHENRDYTAVDLERISPMRWSFGRS